MARETGAMGRVAISTPGDWLLASTPKREGFIAMAKHALGKKSFKPWTNFCWDDFVLLKQLAQVFKTRHLPVSNAEAWGSKAAKKVLPPPKEWSSDVLVKTLSKKVRTKRRPVPAEEDSDEAICVWDSDEGGLSVASPNNEKSPSASNPKPKRIPGKKTKRKRKQVQRKSDHHGDAAHADSALADSVIKSKRKRQHNK